MRHTLSVVPEKKKNSISIIIYFGASRTGKYSLFLKIIESVNIDLIHTNYQAISWPVNYKFGAVKPVANCMSTDGSQRGDTQSRSYTVTTQPR